MISIIAAIGEGNRVIGDRGKLPWRIPEDMRWFREKTSGHPVIMGYNTFLALGRPLPRRTNIVISDRAWDDVPEGIIVASSLKEAIESARTALGNDEVFVIGGGVIYREALSLVDRLYITLVRGEFSGDVFFPPHEDTFSRIIDHRASEGDGYQYEFFTRERGE